MMDNRIFNVNGETEEALIATLDLAFKQCSRSGKAEGWTTHAEKGLIFLWSVDSNNAAHQKFLVPADARQAGLAAFEWLKSEEAKKVPCTGWDADTDHDGHNDLGWRVYCDDWGHVGTWHSIVAVKPAYMWKGK